MKTLIKKIVRWAFKTEFERLYEEIEGYYWEYECKTMEKSKEGFLAASKHLKKLGYEMTYVPLVRDSSGQTARHEDTGWQIKPIK